MTDPEVKAREIALHWFGHASSKHWADELASSIATALREASTQALEEAAKVADARVSGGEWGTWQAQEGQIIATGIRAMKDTTP